MGSFIIWAACFISLSLLFREIDALAKPFHGYKEGEPLMVKFNWLTSEKSIFPLNLYDLPLCFSKSSEIKESPLNLGQILMGDKLQMSPYHLKMNINESFVHICETKPLSASQIQQYGRAIDQNYHINMFLDGLPAMSPEPPSFRKPWTGSPVGFRDFDTYYVFNHLKLKILIRKTDQVPNSFAIVGFEVDPCTCGHQRWPFIGPHIYGVYRLPVVCNGITVTRELRVNETIAFSYEVAFEESTLKWESRWDPYVDSTASIHRGAPFVFELFVCFVLLIWILCRRRRRKERASIPSSNVTIRYPPFPMALSVLIGSGVQVISATSATFLIGWLGFLSSSPRGSYLAQLAYCHVASAVASGYTSVRILKTIDPRNTVPWAAATWWAASVFPVISAVGLVWLNAWQSGEGISIGLTKRVLLLWCVSVPLAFLGGHVASRGERRWKARVPAKEREFSMLAACLYVLGAGLLCTTPSVHEVVHTLWRFMEGFYLTDNGYHLIKTVLSVVTWAQIGALCKAPFGNKWWWSCFLAPASAAAWWYRFFTNYSSYEDKYSTAGSRVVFQGYCFLFCLNYMVAVGAAAFLGAHRFQ